MKTWRQCSIAEKIERWENVDRVLTNMPAHEQKHHFDMHDWGYETECGTIACAAGHCGLDPWFYRRGLSLKSQLRGDGTKFDVAGFFGFNGSYSVFYNTTPRSVSTVAREVRNYIRFLKRHGDDNDRSPDDESAIFFYPEMYYRPVREV